ncbi:hypothetical protein LCGC14_0300480 [marine sediment metagenome]
MMAWRKSVVLTVLLWLATPLISMADQPLTLVAASDLRYALDEILDRWHLDNPDSPVRVIYGSSGRFATQIRQGAPFDLYLSADIAYTEALYRENLTAGPPRPYASGRLVLWSRDASLSEAGIQALASNPPQRLAIARPTHAPYGDRARQAMQTLGIWSALEPRLVYGENIAHTAQMAQSGAADAAIIALSLALHPTMQKSGHFSPVDSSLHAPLEQALVLTRQAADKPAAWLLADFILGPAARTVFTQYGFGVPSFAEKLPQP